MNSSPAVPGRPGAPPAPTTARLRVPVYAERLAVYTDAQLLSHGEAILADLRRPNVPVGCRGGAR